MAIKFQIQAAADHSRTPRINRTGDNTARGHLAATNKLITFNKVLLC